MENETFGEKIKRLRLNKNYTQQELADLIFINKSSISKYEANKQTPDSKTLEKLAAALEVDPNYLLNIKKEYDPEYEIQKLRKEITTLKDFKINQKDLIDKINSLDSEKIAKLISFLDIL